MKTWSKDMAMRIELTERIGKAFQRKKKNILGYLLYTGVIGNLSSRTIDRCGVLKVIWWGMVTI